METELIEEIKNNPELSPEQPENIPANLQDIIKPQKRGRGRPRKDGFQSPGKNEQISDDTKEIIDTLEDFTGDVLEFVNDRLPNPKPVSVFEKKIVGKGIKRVAEKYSVHIEKFGAEVMLAFGLVIFASPRIRKPNPKNYKNSEGGNNVEN